MSKHNHTQHTTYINPDLKSVTLSRKLKPYILLGILILFFLPKAYAQQVVAEIDKDSILIGEEILYQVTVETDSTDLIIFPEGQTFSPLEVIESYAVDTSFAAAKYKLIKKYGLTQFDSGSYTIPQQRILINEQPVVTDSLRVEVNNVQVDTTQQGLYDIKKIIEVERATSPWLYYIIWGLLVLAVIGIFIYLIIRYSKKKAQAEQTLPPFEQAMVSLHKLDEDFKDPKDYKTTKAYYSSLTDIVRRYLDQEVYDKSLESTSQELINKLHQERDAGHIDLSKETINKLQHVLNTADLTKFARITPEAGKAQADRLAIEQVVKETEESLPEPTEEELMRDAVYRDNLAKRRKKKLIITGVFGVLGILVVATGILIATKGFDYVKDNFIGHPSKELLEGDWIRSEYGYPPITLSTPEVLKRVEFPLPEELQGQMQMNTFAYGSFIDDITIMVSNIRYAGDQEADLEQAVETMMATIEQKGVKNLLVKNEKYTTPNGAEGLKTFGTGEFPVNGQSNRYETGEYTMLSFTTPGVVQQIIISWREDDAYAKDIADRLINSVELQKETN